jgi:hypothetical protein
VRMKGIWSGASLNVCTTSLASVAYIRDFTSATSAEHTILLGFEVDAEVRNVTMIKPICKVT